MRLEVLEVFRLAGIDVARDVEVVVVGRIGDLGHRHHAGITRHFGLPVEHVDDEVNVLRAQAVLVSVLEEALARVDHEDAAAGVGVLLVEDQDAGGDAGAVEEVGGQADDPLDEAPEDEIPADGCLLVAAEQHAVRQDDRAFAPAVERSDQMQ